MQFQGKLMIQTQENSKKPHFGPDLAPFSQNSGHTIVFIFIFYFFSKIWLRQPLDIMVSYHNVHY